MNLEVIQSAIARPVAQLSTPEIAAALDVALAIKSVLSQIEQEAERRLKAGEKLDGWELAPGSSKSAIMDPAAAFRILEPVLGENALLDCCSMALGKLETAIAAHRGCTKKEARDFMGKKIGNVILTSQSAPKLSRAAKVIEVTESAGATIAANSDESE
jgi:hypothetical protein